MNRLNSKYLLHEIMMKKGQAEIMVQGNSMNPLLRENDYITIKKQVNYDVGDVIVYFYKTEGLLVHRLLRIENRVYCKGDNAFRIEDIEEGDILGKVFLVNGKPLFEWPVWKTQLSYRIGRLFKANGYDKKVTTQTNAYKVYADIVLHSASDQKYLVNISAIENKLFSNEIEAKTLLTLTEPHSVSELVEKLQTDLNWPKPSLCFEIEKYVCKYVLAEIVSPL